MPILNGVKFSCEPCMRGHRSSKCNHTDRILVKVRKPGRPLSSCPHTLSSSSPGTFVHSSPGTISNGGSAATKTNAYGEANGGNSCSCEITSVAIPKLTSCVCGVSGSASSKSHASCKASKSPSCSEANPLPSPVSSQGSAVFSVNKVAGPRHRVQRKSVAGADGSTTRRASLIADDTAMEFLWKAQQEAGSSDVKVEKGSKYGVIETGLTGVKKRGDGRSRYTNGVSCASGAGNGFSLTDPKGPIQGREFPVAVGATFSPSNGVPAPKPGIGNGMVPADGWSSTLDLPFFGEVLPTDAPHMARPGGGCCSSSRSAPQTPQNNFDQRPSTVPRAVASYCNGGAGRGGNFVAKPGSSPLPVPDSEFSASLQYNPTYDTTDPLEESLPRPSGPSTVTLTARELAWVQYLRATGFSSPPPLLGAGFLPDFRMTSGGEESRQSTECNCGPDCNCLGCISHPYNPRTIEYVKGLRSFALDDQTISPFHSQSNSPTLPQSHLSGPVDEMGEAGDPIASVHSHTATTRANINLIIQTPPPPSSPDRESSTGAPENGVSPSAFVLVDYQIGPCSEADTECKCGDGCICLNCLSHGKNYEVEMVRNAQWDASGLNGAGAGVATGPNWWGFGSNGPVEANSWSSV